MCVYYCLYLSRTSTDTITGVAGPGGATVASRLTENPGFTVLLIEAGPRYAASSLLTLYGAPSKVLLNIVEKAV